MGFYVLLADDTEKGYESDRDWYPKLYPYMQNGANVLFFTFINPTTMEVPPAFVNLAKSRGSDESGAVPQDTVILFALGLQKLHTPIVACTNIDPKFTS